MNKVTLNLPEKLHLLLRNRADAAGMRFDAYLLDLIEQHLDDMTDLAAAEAALGRLNKGEDKVLTAEEFWRGLDD
ncbi:DUF6290 family protein [Allorhizobium sp. BGMRC 0089]|uniref:type II toxin-antitoxin system RelB family antitoxin n=1 Tax=Allorhizobium sonneratiae TaxID=2934936 RepID=UPI0020334446|nr:DUF6290 family protein [Allorhizobium sonneratiae]MCM2293837.1 DUF6290 family protein [Allorhizobium sonneratiae]